MTSSPRVFSIEGKGLKLDTADSVNDFAAHVTTHADTLEEVRLGGNTWSTEAMVAFCAALSNAKHIKHAHLSDIFTSRLKETIPPSLSAICGALKDKDELVYVDLSDNAFGPIGAKNIAPLISNNPNIQILKLNNNGLGPEGGKALASALLALKESKRESQLRSIVIGRNRLENGSMGELAAALASLPHLRTVSMPQDGIRPEGIVTLLRNGLSKCVELEELDLQDNTFTEQGSVALAEAMQHWPKLRVLNIGDCLLRATGAMFVMKALEKAPILEILNLEYNEISEKGAFLLAQSLYKLTLLNTLLLNGNRFEAESEGAEAIRKALIHLQKEDIIDEWDDMEEPSEIEEEEKEKSEESQQEDELTNMTSKLKI